MNTVVHPKGNKRFHELRICTIWVFRDLRVQFSSDVVLRAAFNEDEGAREEEVGRGRGCVSSPARDHGAGGCFHLITFPSRD